MRSISHHCKESDDVDMKFKKMNTFINGKVNKAYEIKRRVNICFVRDFISEELDYWSHLFLLLSQDIKNKKSERKIVNTAALCESAITYDYFEYFWFRSFQDEIQIYEKKVNDKIRSLDRSYEDYPLDTLISLGESNELIIIVDYLTELKYELYST